MTSKVRRWAAGVGLASGATVAAALIGTASAPAAHADDGSLATDIGLLDSAEANIADVFNLTGQPDTIFPDVIGKIEAIQTPLLSSDNSFLSSLGESLFNGPDQQLAQASDAALSAAEAYTADPTATNGLADVSAALQFDGSLLGNTLPANVIGKLVDQLFDVGGFDTTSASAGSDLASSTSSAATLAAAVTGTPDDVMGQAASDLMQSDALLATAPMSDLSTDQADFLANEETIGSQLGPGLDQIASVQDSLPASDQTFLVNADEQLVTAAQNLLTADQAFISADQAGELSGTFTSVDYGLIDANIGLISADFTALGDTIFAGFVSAFPDLGIVLP